MIEDKIVKRWQTMTLGELQNIKLKMEKDIMEFVDEKVAEFYSETDLHVLDVTVNVRHHTIGQPPSVVQVILNAPVRQGLLEQEW